MDDIMKSVTNAIYPIGMMILIIGGGGTFKQVLIDGGVGDTIAKLFEGSTMSPILSSMDCRAVLRIALGSATVAAFQQQVSSYHYYNIQMPMWHLSYLPLAQGVILSMLNADLDV